jgi:pyruvate/2-oxoglutarate dehydrogenase complex dihydrolipoamide acyltransferase (E2) component
VAERSFPLPDLGEGLIDATILEWLVSPGQFVERNAPLVEVETTKSALEIPSPISGVVKELHAEEGQALEVGRPLVTFEVPDNQAGIVGTVPVVEQAERRVRLSLPDE